MDNYAFKLITDTFRLYIKNSNTFFKNSNTLTTVIATHSKDDFQPGVISLVSMTHGFSECITYSNHSV